MLPGQGEPETSSRAATSRSCSPELLEFVFLGRRASDLSLSAPQTRRPSPLAQTVGSDHVPPMQADLRAGLAVGFDHASSARFDPLCRLRVRPRKGDLTGRLHGRSRREAEGRGRREKHTI